MRKNKLYKLLKNGKNRISLPRINNYINLNNIFSFLHNKP